MLLQLSWYQSFDVTIKDQLFQHFHFQLQNVREFFERKNNFINILFQISLKIYFEHNKRIQIMTILTNINQNSI